MKPNIISCLYVGGVKVCPYNPPQEIYGISLQLFEKAREMAENGECDKELLEVESNKLEAVVHIFAASLDERRDLLVQACTFYCNFEMVCSAVTHAVDPSLDRIFEWDT